MKKYYVFGSCHIDLAWRSEAAYHQKLLETMTERLLALLDEYPDMTYVIEQANHYRTLSTYRPDLMARLKERIAQGRIEVVGGMSSSMETNMPCGESFIRNQLKGLKWFEENLDAKITTGWLVDTFGINAQVPQILKKCGIKYLQANRFGGRRDRELFYDRALDGSTVLMSGRDAFSPNLPAYKDSRIFFQQSIEKDDMDKYFDAITVSQVEGPILVNAYIEEQPPTENLPHNVARLNEKMVQSGDGSAAFALPRDFFEIIESEVDHIPTLEGDLNPEFTGTFSQRNIIKIKNRLTEGMLIDAEKWMALLAPEKYQDAKDLIDAGWFNLAFVHFHDVFTGSHPDCVMQDVLSRLSVIRADSRRMLETAFGAKQDHKNQFTLINSLPFERTGYALIKAPDAGEYAVSIGGKTIPAHRDGDNLRFIATLPPMGAVSASLVPVAANAAQAPAVSDEVQLENDWLVLRLSRQNGVYLFDKQSGKILLNNVKNLILMQQDTGNFQYENICGNEANLWRSDKVTVGLAGNTEQWQKAYAEFPFAYSRCRLEFTVRNDIPSVMLDVHVDWQEEGTRLRLKLDTEIQPANDGLYEVPFGVVRRKPYSPGPITKGEWPAQRFTAIDNDKHGLALVNRGACGVEIMGSQLMCTLLRSPTKDYIGMIPDHTSSQHGKHLFSFELIPYIGSWHEADLPRRAQSCNTPFDVVKGNAACDSQLSIPCSNILLSTVKYMEIHDPDAIVVRAYETFGNQTDGCRLYVKGTVKAFETDMRENVIRELPCEDGFIEADFGAFEIKTIKVIRK